MPKEETVVKSFRVTEDRFNQVNEIFKKEGFSFSEVIRLLCDATIREGRIPRALSNKDSEVKSDKAQVREEYIDSVLSMAGIVPKRQRSMTFEQRLLDTIFGEKTNANEMSNKDLREWAIKWGFPDDISVSTLAELHDSGIFPDDPWYGAYDADIQPVHPRDNIIDDNLQTALIIMEAENNLKDNLEQIKREFQTRAMKYLMEFNNKDN